MRALTIGSQRFTTVRVLDEPSYGGACHTYHIGRPDLEEDFPSDEFGYVRFQKGPVKEAGINGCHQEDLIAIVIDRLQHFQKGDFKCRENALALTKLEEAMHWLNHRTRDREKREVEGTNQQ